MWGFLRGLRIGNTKNRTITTDTAPTDQTAIDRESKTRTTNNSTSINNSSSANNMARNRGPVDYLLLREPGSLRPPGFTRELRLLILVTWLRKPGSLRPPGFTRKLRLQILTAYTVTYRAAYVHRTSNFLSTGSYKSCTQLFWP